MKTNIKKFTCVGLFIVSGLFVAQSVNFFSASHHNGECLSGVSWGGRESGSDCDEYRVVKGPDIRNGVICLLIAGIFAFSAINELKGIE